jgi:hypothetical protein
LKPNPFPPDKRLFSLAALIWLLSPATQALFLGVPLPGSPLVAPSSFGERIFSLAYVVLEHMGWWLWPFGRDWVLRPLDPRGLFAINLLFWLILVLMLRHAWRLRKYNPWVVAGLGWAVAWLLPVGVLVEMGGQPFSQKYLLVPGLGLALMMASLIIQCARFASRPRCPRAWKHLYLFMTAVLTVWVVCLAVEDGIRWSRDTEARLRHTVVTDDGNAPAAAELARIESAAGQYAQAEALLLNAERAVPWYREYPYLKAEILIEAGSPSSARHYVDQLLKANPDDLRALELQTLLDYPAPPAPSAP